MVTSIPSTSAANPAAAASAPTQRPHADEALKRQEAATHNKPATEDDTTVVQISQQGAKLAEQAVAGQPAKTAPARPAAETGASGATGATGTAAQASSKPEAAFEPADGNKDGRVTEFEQQAYDFKHPKSLAELIAEEKAAAANGLSAGLKAYEEVARSGRSA